MNLSHARVVHHEEVHLKCISACPLDLEKYLFMSIFVKNYLWILTFGLIRKKKIKISINIFISEGALDLKQNIWYFV